MKKTINVGLVCFITLLLACEPDDGVRICNPPCTGPPPPPPITIHTVYPSAGSVGDEVVLVVSELPEDAMYGGKPYGSGNENAPWISATVGDESAPVLSATNGAVTIKVPPFLEPGNYQITLNIGGEAVHAPGTFEVYNPKL